jgi:hypothetical protein
MVFLVASVACAICGAPDSAPSRFQPIDFEYWIVPDPPLLVRRCAVCGSEFVAPRPSIPQLISFYPLHYHAYNEDHGSVAGKLVGVRGRARRKQYRALLPGRSPIRLFDVGAGDCRQFDDLNSEGGFEFGGVEVKPEMVQAARARGYEVVEGTLEAMEMSGQNERWDIVTMYQVVEHVLAPQMMMDKAFAMLRPGGVVVGQLPCIDSLDHAVFGRHWAGYHFPRHLQMFTKGSLRVILERAGFVDIEVRSALHLQAALSLQNVIVDNFGGREKMRFGKTPYYTLLLLVMAPFCLLEALLGRGGMMNFMARKPEPAR